MAVLYESQIIEIPHLGLSDCITLSGVPKSSSQTWTVGANGVRDPSTTRLKRDANGVWIVTTSGDETACAANAASSGSTTGNIKVYPMMEITVPNKKHGLSTSPGAFSVSPAASYPLKVKKPSNESWNKGQQIYVTSTYPHTLSKSGSNFAATTMTASPCGESSAYVIAANTIREQGSNVRVDGNLRREKVKAGANTIYGQPVSVDVSGAYFSSTQFFSGISTGDVAVSSADVSGNCTILDPRMDMINLKSYDDAMVSLVQPMQCFLIPIFHSVQTIENRKTTQCVVYSDQFFKGNTQSYTYNYKIQAYRVMTRINGATVSMRGWYPDFVMNLPAITWTRTLNLPSDMGGSPPGPLDLGATHHLILGADYALTSQSSLSWTLYAKSASYPMSRSYVEASKPIQTAYTINQVVKDQSGNDNVICFTEYMAHLPLADLTTIYNFGIGSFQAKNNSGGTSRIEFRVMKGSDQVRGWSDMSTTSFGSDDNLNYLWFGFSLSLADCGETDPTQYNQYTIQTRQYSVSVNPYASNSYSWGLLEPTMSLNYTGSNCSYDHKFKMMFPFDKPPYTYRTLAGHTITTPAVIGYTMNKPPPSATWSGDVSYNVANHTHHGLKKFRISSDINPSTTSDLITAFYQAGVTMRLKRSSDGRYLDTTVNDSNTTAQGFTWSRNGKWLSTSNASQTLGSDKTATYPIAFTTNYLLFDAVVADTYELEVRYTGSIVMKNRYSEDYGRYYKHKVFTFSL
jgi:hypothetical protein